MSISKALKRFSRVFVCDLRACSLRRRLLKHLWLTHPSLKVNRHFRYISLKALFHSVQELVVTAVELIECPGGHTDAMAQSTVDLAYGNLGFRLKLRVIRDICFFPSFGVARPFLR